MKEIKTNTIVKKSNALINGYAQYLDVREMRLIAQTAARITVKDKDFEVYSIPVKDISDSNKNIYEEIKEVCRKLMKRIVEIEEINEDGKKQLSIYGIFSRCRYIDGSGYIETKFDPDLKPYFLELKNQFTKFNIETLMKIPSTYSYRIYELLKQYSQGGLMYREFEIEELQNKLNITIKHASSYRAWGDFQKRVLKPAQKHLKKYTDIEFEYHGYAKFGRKFTHIKFTIKNKESKKKINRKVSLVAPNPTYKLEKLQFESLKNLALAGNKQAQAELKKRQ